MRGNCVLDLFSLFLLITLGACISKELNKPIQLFDPLIENSQISLTVKAPSNSYGFLPSIVSQRGRCATRCDDG